MSRNLISTRDLISTPKRKGLLPISRATLQRWLHNGKFPRPHALSSNTFVWDLDEVMRWLDQTKGASDE